ncbi:hypothetical protein [Desulforhopalus vacuolatus]|nr:hypothetical protein [Desulforhopalus vacuolatus]
MVRNEVQILLEKYLVSLGVFDEKVSDRNGHGNDVAGINSKDLVV